MNLADQALEYRAFLEAKVQNDSATGFEPVELPGFLFDFQRVLLEWALRTGRGAILADCGLGQDSNGIGLG
jgi:hypothetical protein